MSEPLSPLAAGVASALTSLRKRAGLREGRLAGSELALDTLVGLDSVKELIAAGDPPERAVVRTVSAAARMLEPTYSIVADVSLGLELSAPDGIDPELYASDLGRRREALRKNWDRLHALRTAAPAGPVPSPRALRLEVEAAALAALAVALTNSGPVWGVSGTTASDGAVSFPDGTRSAPGAAAATGPPPSGTATELRTGPQEDAPLTVLPQLMRSHGPRLLDEFRRISSALRDALVADGNGQGWPHDLRKGSKPYTPWSTACALKALMLLEGYLANDLKPVVEQLRKPAVEGEGYSARMQTEPRPEATAAVLNTLHRIDVTANYGEQVEAMKNDLGGFEKTRPFILTTVLETNVQLNCDPVLTQSIIKDLLAARRKFGNLLLWPEKAEANLVAAAPSVVHTARAVWALALAQAARSADHDQDGLYADVRAAVDQAAVWLTEQKDLANVSENIDRLVGNLPEHVYVRHFTPAWVVKALVAAGLPASHTAVSGAMARIWDSYSREAALWGWGNGDLPGWMTLDAVEALRLAALATTIPSLGGLGVA